MEVSITSNGSKSVMNYIMGARALITVGAM
jgi:hypothetical protein